MSLALAAFKRDFAQARSYRIPFVLDTATIVFTLLLAFGFGRLVTAAGRQELPGASDYFTFAVLGLVVVRLAQSATLAPVSRVRLEQTTGTLEALLASPLPAWRIVLAGSTYDLFFALFSGAVTLGLGAAIFGVHLSGDPVEDLGGLLAALASLAFVTGLGLVVAAFTVVVKQAVAVAGFIGAALTAMAGVYFPVRDLPSPLRTLGAAIPFTWGLDALRSALLAHHPRWALIGELLAADLGTIVVGAILIEGAVRRARRTGTLSHY